MKSKNRKRQTERKAPDKKYGVIPKDRVKTRKFREYIRWFMRCIPEKSFNFGVYHLDLNAESKLKSEWTVIREVNCGTVGCIIGHLTERYPNLAVLAVEKGVCAAGMWNGFLGSFYSCAVKEIFNIKFDTFVNLFYPDGQGMVHPDLPICNGLSSKKEVCDMMLLFCDLYDNGSIEKYRVEKFYESIQHLNYGHEG